MRRFRYLSFAFLTLTPALALAQLPDSVLVVDDGNGIACAAYGAAFGVRVHDVVGPHPLALAEPYPYRACEPLTNPDEVAGSVVLVSGGSCPYTQKVQHAVAAGAEAVVVFNDDFHNPDALIVMKGECPPEVCSAPAVSVSYNCGTVIITQPLWNPSFTLVPIRVVPPVTVEEEVPEGSYLVGPTYPNPFSSHASVELHLPGAQAVRVAVYDVLGREIAVLHEGRLEAGAHRFVLDGSRLPAGVYVVRMEMGVGAARQVRTQRVTVLK